MFKPTRCYSAPTSFARAVVIGGRVLTRPSVATVRLSAAGERAKALTGTDARGCVRGRGWMAVWYAARPQWVANGLRPAPRLSGRA